MSFWDFLNQWQGGAAVAATLAAVPLLSLFALNSQGKLNVTGWDSSSLHGLYSRVKLFLKNGSTENSGNAKSDLVVQIPLTELGAYSKYKWCISESSKLKKPETDSAKVASSETSQEKCELQYFENTEGSHKADTENISYLLEIITKYLEVQHAANMLLLYDKDLTFSDNTQNGVASKIKQACSISNSETFKVIQELFLGSSNFSKNCLMSPILVDIFLRLNNSSSSHTQQASSTNATTITKEQLQSGTLSGVINYGIFDYSSYKKLKEIPSLNNGSQKKKYSLKINWEIPYSLKKETESNGNSCSLEKSHLKTKNRELKLQDIKECINSIS